MKKAILFLVILSTTVLLAQESKSQNFKTVNSKTYLLLENQIIKGDEVIQKMNSILGDSYTYNKVYRIQVNDRLYYEMGEIKTTHKTYSVLFIQSKKVDNNSQVEFLIVYNKDNVQQEFSELDTARSLWMKLCNAHNAEKLVNELYQPEGYYYNRGRLLQGNQAITKEYQYMNSPNYSLKLTPKKITLVNDHIAFELGRCSGSYPLPYLLLWQKQADNSWQILLDSNY